MEITSLILFCGLQIIGLIFILLRKKFRTLPNYLLVFILVNIISHYIYYYFYYKGLFTEDDYAAFSVVPIAGIAPIIIYYYVDALLLGELKARKKDLLIWSPFLLSLLLFVPFILADTMKFVWIFAAKSIIISTYIIFPLLIVRKIAVFYKIEDNIWDVFQYNRQKTFLIKLLLSMMCLHFVILLFKNNLPLLLEGTHIVMNYINLAFLLLLGYAISYVIVSEPKSIIHIDEKVGLAGFKKYDKSKLTQDVAHENLKKLNGVMDEQKPYLDPDFNLQKLVELTGLSNHNISETLNGLIGQSFNDYTNNYRVEEFKRMAAMEEFKNFTILALAFESGFKSKSTFNAAFKKFTNQTPSQFIKSLSK